MVDGIAEIDRIGEASADNASRQAEAAGSIARTIDETTRLLNEVAEGMVRVYGDAQKADTQSQDVDGISSSVASEVESLQNTLTRIVQTASPSELDSKQQAAA